MKFKAIIGAILAVAAAFRLLCLAEIIPLHFISDTWENEYEPYFAAVIVLVVGACVCYDGITGSKNEKNTKGANR